MRMCATKSNKEDLTSSVVLEMLVYVGIPWKGDFCLVCELLPRFCWMKSVGHFCIIKVGSSKINLEPISKQ